MMMGKRALTHRDVGSQSICRTFLAAVVAIFKAFFARGTTHSRIYRLDQRQRENGTQFERTVGKAAYHPLSVDPLYYS